jgi:tripartite-type tricarboxylate transporter receptor subunit TctC
MNMKRNKQRVVVIKFAWLFVMLSLFSFLVMPQIATAKEWPTKTITIICGTTPGGVSDVTTRAISAEMSKILGVSIVVVNMPGGGGGVAAENVFRAPNDGYTWHTQGSGFRTFAVMGLHASPPKDWYCIPTTTYVGAVAVKEGSPYKTFPDLVEATKKDPGKIAYSASLPGTAWKISMEIIRLATGLSGRYVPYPGTSVGQVAVLTGDVQFVMSGVGEQAELLRGKKLRALATFNDKAYQLKGYGVIPAITDYLPELKPHLPYRGWSSISLRGDIPKPILKKIDEAFLKAIQTKSVKEYCEKFEADLIGVVGEEAQKMYLKQTSLESWLLYDLGVAKRNPEEFMIPKP